MTIMKKLIVLLLFTVISVPVSSIADDYTKPRVLIVIAHPDDDATFAATVYKITHDLGGTVDLALITNGEGGYKYSTLAEDIYDLELTEEEIGRKNLPDIRKKELMEGGAIVGYNEYFFLDQKDHKYTNDIGEVLDSVWDTTYVKERLTGIMKKGNYDFVFILRPSLTTHAHHSSAGILTLKTISEMPEDERPIVLGGTLSEKDVPDTSAYTGLEAYPVTNVSSGAPEFEFDRTTPFGFNDRLNYKIIVNWLIAEHKTQGTMQLLMDRGDIEKYIMFDIDDRSKVPEIDALFDKLNEVTFKKKTYDTN